MPDSLSAEELCASFLKQVLVRFGTYPSKRSSCNPFDADPIGRRHIFQFLLDLRRT
ncbi:hypothetical protein BG19_2193 [Burkholderia pseudomallei MSHR840]|nr:hypothetical protein BG19_2193 [Burkholderia pseudomallei MSHR840]